MLSKEFMMRVMYVFRLMSIEVAVVRVPSEVSGMARGGKLV